MEFKDKVFFITGASRGIGRAMALKLAKAGAHIVIAAKTKEPHPTLSGTIDSVAEEVRVLGSQALPLVVDVRDEQNVMQAFEKTIETFGRLDGLINNASAIHLAPTSEMTMKAYDLIFSVNQRATFLCAKYALAHLQKSDNPHILTISPPLNLQARWFAPHLAYTMSKYGMSLCTLGLAAEFSKWHIAANSLWPKTTIATAAIANHFPEAIYQASRYPDIMADAAFCILKKSSRECTGQFFIDEEILKAEGVTDFSAYALNPGEKLFPDLFV